MTFPLTEKVEVNGRAATRCTRASSTCPTSGVAAATSRWNFEKFVVDRAGHVVERFSPTVEPEDARIVAVLEAAVRS